ncbi:kinase suppressor of Ras 2-like [Oncorhynchus nerka]|uniref:kinase suppressor of Ras 2-like n=1 Tax=Oncorhynchus nerka TaxID=8023 RepID=UPI0031B89C14
MEEEVWGCFAGDTGKLVKYFSRQLSCKVRVALQEDTTELQDFPRLGHWFRIVNLRKEVTEEMGPGEVTLEGLLEMSDEEVCEAMEKFGANDEECARLNASLTCLRRAHKSEQLEDETLPNNGAGSHAKQDWSIQWPTSESGKENTPFPSPEPSQWVRFQLSQSPKVQAKYKPQHHSQYHSPQALLPYPYGPYVQPDRLTVDSHLGLGAFPPMDTGHRSLPPSPRQRHFAHTPPRTPLVVNSMTPPGTPPMRRRNKVKAPGTPPPPSRKLIHLLPGFTALHRSKSHEFQLGNRIGLEAADIQTPKVKQKKSKPQHLKINSSMGSCENLPTQRSPLHSSDHRSLRSFFFPTFMPSTPPVYSDATRLVRTESVPCDINNPLRYTDLHISQTLPKTSKINKDHIPVPYQPDSSSNPSSTTSSTPSSPVPPLPSSATPPSPLHPSPQSARLQKQFSLTGTGFK